MGIPNIALCCDSAPRVSSDARWLLLRHIGSPHELARRLTLGTTNARSRFRGEIYTSLRAGSISTESLSSFREHPHSASKQYAAVLSPVISMSPHKSTSRIMPVTMRATSFFFGRHGGCILQYTKRTVRRESLSFASTQ